ncbi:MAG: FAD-linked oxidase C-terminal domain-containing protein [Planctomycetota bacterium]
MALLDTMMMDDLARGIGGDVLADDLARAMYATAAGVYQILPLAVVRPQCRDDIIKTLRWAAANGVPVTIRGSGTSPTGACLGSGIIIDMTTHMGSAAEIDVHGEMITAPAGAVFARLNEALASFNRCLPLSPPGGEIRTIGGMIATNTSGIGSAKYGSIIEYVESLELVLADGSVIETCMHDVRQGAFKELIAGDSAEARITKAVYDLLRDNRGLTRSKTPSLLTNSSGYQLARTLAHGHMDLGQLLTGSEGTLAVITKATLRSVERPAMTAMIILYFENAQLAADSVVPILEAEPRSVEMIDARALDLVKNGRPDLGHFLREGAESVLIVEFEGEDNDEIIPKLLETQRLIADEGGTAADSILATAEPDMDEARELRAAALNVPHNIREPSRVTPFIEDIAVPPDMVSSCVHGLCETMKKRGLDMTINGHVGHGNVSARPLLDLKKPDDIRAMREVAEEVFDMVIEMGGTISSVNGDGRSRTEFLRRQYGELCDVFAEVKRIFDSGGLLNPGIKVGGERGTIVSNLRYGPDYSRRHVEPKLQYAGEPREDVIEKCHGCGACRSMTGLAAMCPVYKALQTEEASPRAKANILRHLLSSQGSLPPEDEVVAEMTRLTDLCVNCKMCSVECPAGIDVAKLMIELRARRAEKSGLAWDEKVAKRWNTIMSFLATFSPVGNFLMQNRAVRFLAEKAFGIAARRELPRFRGRELRGRHRPTLTKARDRVAYFTDRYVDCCNPEIAQCALDVLIRNGSEVEIISGADTGATRLMYGDIAGARKIIERNVKRLEPLVVDGFRVVFTNPQSTLFFRKAILDCVDSPPARAVAAASFDLMQFLLSLHRAGRLDTRFRAVPIPLAYFAPCHLRALQIGKPSLELLRLIPELPIADLGGGCCGMADTFGLRKKNYDLSMKIGRPLFDELRHLEVRCGVTECGSCAAHLAQGAGKRILHPVQVLHRAYGLPAYGMPTW